MLSDEALRVRGVGDAEDRGPLSSEELGPAVVDVGGRVIADPRMTMIVVVPGANHQVARCNELSRRTCSGSR